MTSLSSSLQTKVERTLKVSDKIIKLLEEDEKLDFDHSVYAVMSTLLYLQLGKIQKKMNLCLESKSNGDPQVFLDYLDDDFKRWEGGIASNIMERINELDNRMKLKFYHLKQKQKQQERDFYSHHG